MSTKYLQYLYIWRTLKIFNSLFKALLYIQRWKKTLLEKVSICLLIFRINYRNAGPQKRKKNDLFYFFFVISSSFLFFLVNIFFFAKYEKSCFFRHAISPFFFRVGKQTQLHPRKKLTNQNNVLNETKYLCRRIKAFWLQKQKVSKSVFLKLKLKN